MSLSRPCKPKVLNRDSKRTDTGRARCNGTQSQIRYNFHPLSKLLTRPPHSPSLSIDQAAQVLGVSRRTIYNRIREGRLQTMRTIGGSQRVLRESLQQYGVS